MKKIEKDTDRDYFMSPDEAKEYGLIDEVLVPRIGADKVPMPPVQGGGGVKSDA
jgi:ATP-dependent protease ClpP protease subunit